jgi:hydroxymethylglutaryl-CoA lyase
MALSLPRKVVVAEVGPRDGLQSFPRFIDTDTKVAMIDKLSDLGLPIIEVSSFAHPNIVPHLRDAEEVFERIKRRPATVYRALVPNARGAERGAKARVDEMLGLITISATYTRKNQNMTIDQAIAQNLTSFKIADASGIPFVMALGMAFWCAYEGQIPEKSVIAVVQRLHDGGIRRFYLAGSLGMEDPAHVNRLFRRLAELFPNASFGFHIHNLSGMATANILAALDAGAEWLEGAFLRHRRRHRHANQAWLGRQFSNRRPGGDASRDGHRDRDRPGTDGRCVARDRGHAWYRSAKSPRQRRNTQGGRRARHP